MHKIVNKNFIGSYKLTYLTDTHNYGTRLSTSNNFYHNYTRTKYGQSTSSIQGTKLWRTISQEIKELPFYKFKQKLKENLFIELQEGIT